SLALLEAAIRIMPSLVSAYDSLAAWYLEQKLNPQRAVELCEMVLELSRSPNDPFESVRKTACAWAFALIGQNNRADVLIEQALETVTLLELSAQANINRQIAYARLAQNNREAAREHFQKAVELDSDGIYGKLARRALDSLEA
ncbi:MAG: hypothetical protein K8I30_12310, partial [Anaerolineae bacterium]|nr:hypothetical protein [Anaerolineae bacterium]